MQRQHKRKISGGLPSKSQTKKQKVSNASHSDEEDVYIGEDEVDDSDLSDMEGKDCDSEELALESNGKEGDETSDQERGSPSNGTLRVVALCCARLIVV